MCCSEEADGVVDIQLGVWFGEGSLTNVRYISCVASISNLSRCDQKKLDEPSRNLQTHVGSEFVFATGFDHPVGVIEDHSGGSNFQGFAMNESFLRQNSDST